MMKPDGRHPDAADRSLSAMRSAVIPVEDAAAADSRRDRLLPELQRFAHRAHTTRGRGRVLSRVAVAALCAGVCGVLGVVAWRTPSAGEATLQVGEQVGTVQASSGTGSVLIRSGRAQPIARQPLVLAPTDQIETGDGRVSLRLRNGTHVGLDPATRVELQRPTETDGQAREGFAVRSGTVRVGVPKLGPKRQLTVRTPNGLVSVHGTRFSVSVERGQGKTETRVTVEQGRVSVDSGTERAWLGPGQSWSSRPLPAPTTREPAKAPGAAPSAVQPRVRRAPAEGSTLGEENRLFQDAVMARRAGRYARAVELCDRLLARYPGSPLARDARSERQRALDSDRSR